MRQYNGQTLCQGAKSRCPICFDYFTEGYVTLQASKPCCQNTGVRSTMGMADRSNRLLDKDAAGNKEGFVSKDKAWDIM